MGDRPGIAALVHDALTTRWPGRFDGDGFAEDVSLGQGGLGLDSIEIVELLLDCEERLGVESRAEELLEAGPVSIGRLVDHLAAC